MRSPYCDFRIYFYKSVDISQSLHRSFDCTLFGVSLFPLGSLHQDVNRSDSIDPDSHILDLQLGSFEPSPAWGS